MIALLQAVFVATIWFTVAPGAEATASSVDLHHHTVVAVQNDLSFKYKSGANGKGEDGADFSTAIYQSSDGVVISAITETYKTKAKAERALQKRLSGASRILSRTPKTAASGERVGTRVVVRFRREDSYRSLVMIFWTDGADLHSIGARSLHHVEEFEKQFY